MNIHLIKKGYKQKQAQKQDFRQDFRKAFSLVELSMTLLVVATVISTSVIGYKSIISSSKTKVSKDNLDAIYKAIDSYLITNRKLPCPASLTLPKNDPNYGSEVRISGACPSSTSGGVTVSSSNSNLIYGMVPTKTLGLPNDIAEDSFGTKLSYIIDKRFGIMIDNAGTTGFEGSDPDATGMIQIKESSTIISSNAIIVIVSHGANQFGGFNSNGTSQNSLTSATNDEKDNAINASNFDNIFVRISSNSGFDDTVSFRNKMQLAVESGFEKMACRSLAVDTVNASRYCESSVIPTLLTWGKAEYNQELGANQLCPPTCFTSSPNLYPSRKCGKYGVWGPILYPCKYSSSIVCSITGQSGINNQSNLPYTSSPVAIACMNGYSGSPAYTCLSTGPANVQNNNCTPITCTTVAGTGYTARSNLPYATSGSGTFSCDVAGYTGTKNYTCTSPGAATGVSGTCTAITCSVNVTGSTTSSVAYGSGSVSCNVTGYTGTFGYNCTGSTITGNCSCASGYSWNGSSCVVSTPPQCSSYISRSFDDTYSGLGDGSTCHNGLSTGWYRLTGSYPYIQEQGSHAENIANTDAPGFLQFSHPGTLWQTVSGSVGFNWSGSNTYWTSSIQVTNCGSYYVYYLPPAPNCSLAYASGSTLTYSSLPSQCTSYTSRSFDDTYSGLGDGSTCHNGLSTGWYRLTGSYPYIQEQGSHAENIANTDAPGFLQFSHPSTTGQTVSGSVGFNWSGSNTAWTTSIQVTNCGSYYVYYLPPAPVCSLAYASGSTLTYSSLPSQCTSYTSRNFDNTYVGLGDGAICHDSGTLTTGWYRLTGSYPKLQQQGSYVTNIGNTDAPGFMQFSHPSTTGQTVSGSVGFNWNGSNTNWTTSIQVTNCGSYYVYYLPSVSNCQLAYVSGY